METAISRFPFALTAILVTAGGKWVDHVAKFEGIAKYQGDYVFYIDPRGLHCPLLPR